MRKTTLFMGIVAGVAVALLAVLGSGAGTASADNGPHVVEAGATPDKCAACHRLHTGKNAFLLKEAGTVADFCYSCHGTAGTGSSLSVQNGSYYGTHDRSALDATVGLRAGGFDQARINTTDPTANQIGVLPSTQTVNSKHLIDGTAGTMWGNGVIGTAGAGPSATLDCATCHDPHGNGNYRILRSVPTGSGGAGYAIPDTYGKTYTTSNYFSPSSGGGMWGVATAPSTVDSTFAPTAGVSILTDTSNWCAQCHTRYLTYSGALSTGYPGGIPAGQASRVDSGDTTFTFRHTGGGYGYSSKAPAGFKYSNRACITCHATHGSNSSMPGNLTTGTTYSATVPWPDGTATSTNQADPTGARMLKMDNRGMCRKCHTTVQ